VQAKVVDVAQKCMSTQTPDPKMLDALSETLKVALEVWPKNKDIDKLSQQTSKMLEAEFLEEISASRSRRMGSTI